MLHHVQFEQWVAAPLDRVFLFFGDPSNLPRLMPRWMQVKLDGMQIVHAAAQAPAGLQNQNQAGTGSVLSASYRTVPFLPFRITSEAEITAFAPNQYFEDIQLKGPFKSWHHRHEFHKETRRNVEGTLIRDSIDYDPGAGFLGSIANRLFLASQLCKTFAYRQSALEELVRRGELGA